MSCHACDKARSNRYAGEYRMGCQQCVARGFARSTLAADAVRTRSTAELRKALDKALPTMDPRLALQAVREWWKLDHPEQQQDKPDSYAGDPNRPLQAKKARELICPGQLPGPSQA